MGPDQESDQRPPGAIQQVCKNKNYSSGNKDNSGLTFIMSSVQSEIPRLAKKQKNSFQMEIIQLIETEMAQLLDLKYKDMSAVIMNNFKVLMGNLDLMVEEMRESLQNDLKEILGVRRTIPEITNRKNSSTSKEWRQIKDAMAVKTGLVEKLEDSCVEDIENLTFESSKIVKLGSKFDKAKECNTNQGKELPPNESQNHKVLENMEEAIGYTDDTGRNCNIHIEVTGEDQEHGEDVLVKEMREENIPQNFKSKEKILKASEEGGAILTLTANFSSAKLDISKQWSNVFNILRENDYEPKILCQVKLAFKCDGETRTFSDMQSLSKFISQKSFMKELLKDVLPENEKIKKEGRRYGIQEKMDKTLIASKHGAEGSTSDGLSFLFIKEVKVPEPDKVKNLEAQEEEASEWKEKEAFEEEDKEALELEEGEETSGLEQETSESEEGEETSELEEEDKEALELEEGEETSGLEQGTSELEEGEESSELEEEGEASDLEEENTSGLEGKEASVLCKEQHSTFQHSAMANTKHGVKIACDELNILTKKVEDSEQEEEDSEWELEVFLTWEEEGDSEAESRKTTSQTEEKEASCQLKELTHSYLASGSEKKKSMKHRLTSKETDLLQETEENFRKGVINLFREIQEEIGNIKSYHPGNKKFPVLEMKSLIATLSARIDMLEEKINNLEGRIEEFFKDTRQIAKQIRKKERIRDVEDRSRSSNIRLIGIPEKENKENGAEEIVKEIIEENFTELKKDSSLEIVSAYRVPSKIDEKRFTPRHILVKFGNWNDKEKIIRASREREEITYRGIRIRLTADLSLGTLDARSQWGSIISVLQAKGFKPRILYPAKLAFDFEGKTKIFFDTEEFRNFISCIPSLKELLGSIF
ncbi:PREDICTED: LINE-1 type transposase domain-containing protein 1 [Miniopterus natalensis]|uniref:LINE-1 type transposase domain-containing protein 1 n=1 Tax=Miniopterus natalensis TaxID=291302 RepID=UPI0007A6D56C|nr:PREDICTED: LINE-1 type transposase domain-containing protein 1 [Miniopterus natalensis]